MIWTDPIVEDVREIRAAYAARFGYDLDAIFADLKAKESDDERTYVAFSPQPSKFVPVAPARTKPTHPSST